MATQLRVYEVYWDTYYAAKPTLNVTAPTGTQTTNVPQFNWTRTLDSEGGPQTTIQIKVYDATTHGAFGSVNPDVTTPYAESGQVSTSSDRYTLATALGDDDYRGFVRIAQTVNGSLHWSEWDSIDFTVDAPQPGTPTMVLLGQNTQGRIRITLTPVAESLPDTLATTHYEVQVVRSGAWVDIRSPGTITSDGTSNSVAYDLDAPNGATGQYRARAFADEVPSQWTAIDTESWASDDVWLKHATNPDLSTTVTVRSEGFSRQRRDTRQGVFQPIGRADAVVVSDSVLGFWSGEMTLLDIDGAKVETLDTLLEAVSPLLLQFPLSHDEPDRWIVIASHERERIIGQAQRHHRAENVPWTEVAAVTDDLLAWPSS